LNNATEIHYREVLYASAFSIFIASLVSIIENKKMINKIAKKLGITNKYGDENLYSRFLNSNNID